jgi:hypothetical protein
MDHLRAGEGAVMEGDPYNLRVGIRPEELINYPWNLPYVSVFAVTFEALSSSSMSFIGTTSMQRWTQDEVDTIQDSNARRGTLS